LIPREIYKEAMAESIRNAEVFIQEAKIIAEKGSSTHSLLLKNLAIEEVAKAYVCWMVAHRVIPLNHPIVWPRGKKTIFRSHDAKNKIYMDLASAFLLWQMQKEGKRKSGPLTKGEIAGISVVTQYMGRKGTEKRSEWMYVDIVRGKDGKWFVSSPLSNDDLMTPVNFGQIDAIIAFLKSIEEFAESAQFADYLEQMQEETRKSDSDFPPDPLWEI
jgi:AbiV family abortive infection protein